MTDRSGDGLDRRRRWARGEARPVRELNAAADEMVTNSDCSGATISSRSHGHATWEKSLRRVSMWAT